MTALSALGFAGAGLFLLLGSVLRERQVPSTGALRRGRHARSLWCAALVCAVVALAATAVRLFAGAL